MKVTYNWLKDFVAIKISPRELADKLTMAGIEVTSLEEKGGDFIFEIEITSNRPDWLSVSGIAREVAAITNSKLKILNPKQIQNSKQEKSNFKIEIQDKKDCPLYTAKIIRGVKVGPSPEWLRARLELIGCRSINNIVDITNYILFERGEPLHAFDLDKLSPDSIIVRRARQAEKITTIDGQIKTLTPDVLLIADKNSPLAVAGVMGSKDTEVSGRTQDILLEAAVFDPIVIRKGRRKLGLESDSSYRFERGVDMETAIASSWEAVRLIEEIAHGQCVSAKESTTTKPKAREIILDVSFVSKVLGVKIPLAKIKTILQNLMFSVKTKSKNSLKVQTPHFRADVNSEIDLIEEIARIYGYENIPTTIPKVSPNVETADIKPGAVFVKNTLAGLGLNEIITYSLIDRELLNTSELEKTAQVLNPLSKEQEVLRPNLISGLARAIANNLNQKQNYLNIFEIAKVFSYENSRIKEELSLGIGLCGERQFFVSEKGLARENISVLHLKGIIEKLFERLGLKDYIFDMQAGGVGTIKLDSEIIGTMKTLDKATLDRFDIKNKDVLVAQINLERLLSKVNLDKRFTPLPIYPGISRDVSFIIKDDVIVTGIIEAIKAKAQPLIKEVKIADYYKGKQIPSGFKGLTISCFYRSDERTLTESEINPVHNAVSQALVDMFGAQLR